MLILATAMFGAGFVAYRNLARERGDTRGAVRVGTAMAVLSFLIWLSIWEFYLFVMNTGFALLFGAFVAVCYLALEPYVRRTWPHMIVSWSRMIAGSLRDQMVARDELIGLAAAGIVHVLTGAGALVAREVSGIPPRVLSEWRTLLGGTHILTVYLSGVTWGVAISLVLLSMLFALRRLLRREWAAIVAGALVLSVGATLEAGTPLAIIPLLALNLLLFVVLSRVGLISVITISCGLVVLEAFPLTIPPSGWTARLGLIGVISLAALAIVCVRVVTTADARRAHAPATLRQLQT